MVSALRSPLCSNGPGLNPDDLHQEYLNFNPTSSLIQLVTYLTEVKNNPPRESHLGRASFGPAGGQPFEKVAKHIKIKVP
jgi:hypothetical protein